MLNCKIGSLGIPVDAKKIRMQELEKIVFKMRKRLDPWKEKYNSSGGRLLLINTCLSSLPIYLMGFYFLFEGTHKHMDTIRSDFFWQGASNKKKYHMVR